MSGRIADWYTGPARCRVHGVRWPALRRELADTGFASALGIPLQLGTNAAAVWDFFVAIPGAFTEETTKDAELFGEVAARALRLGLRLATAELHSKDLMSALDHRTAIDMARGTIMANRCSGEEAIEILRRVSSSRNQKG